MRLLIVVHALPRHSLGGSERCAAGLAAELANRHEVVVCAGRPAADRGLPRCEADAGYTIEWLDPDPARRPTFDAAYQDPEIERQFDEVVSHVGPDLVFFHGIWGLSNNLPMIARGHGAVVVFTLHDFWLMCPRGQRLRPADLTQCDRIEIARCAECLQPWIAPRRLPSRRQFHVLFTSNRPPLRTILGKAHARLFRPADGTSPASHVEQYHRKTREVFDAVDLFISPSRFLAREFERQCGLSSDRILHSDNGIETAALAACPYKAPTPIVRFAFLGSWMPSKGLHVLIEAFSGLSENARLLLFGGPPAGDPGVYAREILAAGADHRIRVGGRVRPEQLPSVFREIDAIVVPSLWYENAPLTIREAFASHTPVVASRCGGMAESIRDGIDGLLVAPGSVTELRAALRRMIHEPDLIPSLSRQTPVPKSIAEHAVELEGRFRRLLAREHWSEADSDAHTPSHP